MKSQILAGGRGLGTFKSGLKGGVHIVEADKVANIAGMMDNFMVFTFCATSLSLLFRFRISDSHLRVKMRK